MSDESSSPASLGELLRALPEDDRRDFVAGLDEQEVLQLFHDWEVWARPSQRIPEGNWHVWLIMAGRGFGKTRCGAETVRQWIKHEQYVNLIGATADDARDIMVEGESGILAICPKWERPAYRPSKRRLEWPNGAISLIFTADEPERLRGKQHAKLWCDEVASWKYEDAWDQAMFGLRLGATPQTVATTTPKPTKLMRTLVVEPTTFVTRGSTYDNKANLAATFLSKIVTKYEGTRLGRQELNAELLEDNPGALWKRGDIDAGRVRLSPDLARIVVAIDPAVTSNEDSDETGIVVAGRDRQTPPHFYVIDDLSIIDTPDGWAARAVEAYKERQADRIIGEVNNGGEMVEAVIRHKDQNVSYMAVHASRGKQIRAEPIAALYEQGRVHHVGAFPGLEDQMCDWNPQTDKDSPDRVDALVWALTELSDVDAAWIYRDAWSSALLYSEDSVPVGLRGSGGYAERIFAVSYSTSDTCVYLDIIDDGQNWWVDREFYWSSRQRMEQKTDAQHAEELKLFASDTRGGVVVLDAEVPTLQAELLNRGLWHVVASGEEINAIRTINGLLRSGRLRIHARCENLIREMLAYTWDADAKEERPIRKNDRSCRALQAWAAEKVPAWRLGS